jgi:hypothetical protein
MRKWMQLLQDLNLMPVRRTRSRGGNGALTDAQRFMGQDWSFVFLQQFGGTVTIVPPWRLRDYFLTVSDPTDRTIVDYLDGGQRATWPKLAMVQNRLAIEHAIIRAQGQHPKHADKRQ